VSAMRVSVQDQDQSEDVFFGQVVIIVARYFLIVGILAVALSSLSSSIELTMAVLPVIVFLGMNFFLHGRYLTERPANLRLVILTSVVDLVLVTAIVLVGPGETGLHSPFFVLYYPLVLAFAFVVPRRIEVAYTSLAVVLCAGAVFISSPGVLVTPLEQKELLLRLVTLAASGGIANYYWRMLRTRRRADRALPTAA
jgi:hypothetical protein